MATIEREIRSYQLVMSSSLDEFNERVNQQLDAGFQFMNNEGVRVEEVGIGVTFRAEMVRYVPDQQVEIDRMMNQPMTGQVIAEAAERNRNGTIVMDRTRTNAPNDALMDGAREVRDIEDGATEAMPERPFWTADSPDPFEDDDEFNDDEVNDHQMNRIGLLNQPDEDAMEEAGEETVIHDDAPDGPRQTMPSPELRNIVDIMTAQAEDTDPVPF